MPRSTERAPLSTYGHIHLVSEIFLTEMRKKIKYITFILSAIITDVGTAGIEPDILA